MRYEAIIKSAESEETSDLGRVSWRLPIVDSLKLAGLRANSSRPNNVAAEFDFRLGVLSLRFFAVEGLPFQTS